ncbi:MAG: hypothetical protein ACI93R_000037 [Flavobacteriales bacterium]|jgi:hypothetical protein
MTNTATDNSERRRYTRVNFDTAATIVQGTSVFHTHVEDLSINGLLLTTPDNYEIRADQPADVSIFLSQDIEIQMKVKLVHSGHDVLGFQCESIDMDSIAHLRRLIELNIDDPSASERVLSELLNP